MKNLFNQRLLRFALAVCVLASGCVSHKAEREVVAEAVRTAIVSGFEPTFDLARASNEFRVAKGRWPKNFDDLSVYLQPANDKTNASFGAVKYQKVTFADAPEGKLRVDANFSFSSGGTGQIQDMVISPVDPRELLLRKDEAR